MFGGWSGSFLGDLWRFDTWHRTWTEIASARLPSARYGHAAAFDAHSMSLLIYGGTQPGGFTSDLWNFSLLDEEWTTLAAAAPDKPPGRQSHSMSWDPTARTLLAFGGFGGTYRDDLWRYSAVPRSKVLVVECSRGQPCVLDEPNFTGPAERLTASDSATCSQTEFRSGLPSPGYMEQQGSTFVFGANSPVFVEPGRQHLQPKDMGLIPLHSVLHNFSSNGVITSSDIMPDVGQPLPRMYL